MCAAIGLMLFGPRLILFLWWLLEPAKWAATFDTVVLPLIGFFVFPWTTVAYVIVAPQGVVGADFVLIGVAVLADVASMVGGSWKGRGEVRGYQVPPSRPPMSPP